MSGRLGGVRAVAAAGLIGVFLGTRLRGQTAAGPVPEGDIRDIRGPIVVLPTWALTALIAGAVILAVAIYGYWRWRRRHRLRTRILLPYEIALQRLEQIRELMQPATARAFSTAASDIVRGYIEQQFDIAVTRQTTEEFLRDLETPNASLARHRPLLEEFLRGCDYVKFAAMSLNSQDMESLHQSARAFVLATAKPEDTSATQEAHDALPTT
jgi:hypothetical protein